MLNKKIIYVALAIIITGFISWSCTKVTRDNPLDPGASNYVGIPKTNKIVLLADDFESYGTAVPPTAPWITNPFGGSCEITPVNGYNSTKGLRFYSAASSGLGFGVHQLFNLTGHFFVEFNIHAPVMFDFKTCFRLTDLSGITTFLEIGWNNTADPLDTGIYYFYYNNGSGNSFPKNITPSMAEWYRIKAEIDTEKKVFNAWYKNALASDFIELIKNANISLIPQNVPRFEFKAINLRAGASTDDIIYDNLEIYKFEVVQPK